MLDSLHFPTEMTGHQLDDYLSRGWFRMGQTIFTTDFIPVGNKIYRVFWLRLLVQKVSYGSKQKKLLATNKRFSVEIKKFEPNDELEDLYVLYRDSVNFSAPLSAAGFLLTGSD